MTTDGLIERVFRESSGRSLAALIRVLGDIDLAEDAVQEASAITLRLLGGLSTDEVARSFLIAEPTMAQRLVRPKHKIKAAHIPYRVPADDELRDRLRFVLRFRERSLESPANTVFSFSLEPARPDSFGHAMESSDGH